MIRVLHVITGLDTGGAETMLCKLLEAMPSLEFQHHVVSLRDEGTLGQRIRAREIPVTSLRMPRGVPTVRAVLDLRRVARAWRPHVVQGWMYHGNLAALAAAGADQPVVWNVRQSLPDMRLERPLTRQVIRLGARLSGLPRVILYNSEAGARDHARIGYRADRAKVIPNGFDADRFRPDPGARDRLLARLGLATDVRLIGMVARYHPLKDHGTLLRAAERIMSERTDVHLVLAGRGMEPSNPLLQPGAIARVLAGRMHAIGECPDVADLTAGLDIATLSSKAEGFPNVLGEAMACGVPCVATDVGDVAEVLGGVGLVVPRESPDALSRAWSAILDESGAERQARSLAARQRIEESFSMRAVSARYEELYRCLHPRR